MIGKDFTDIAKNISDWIDLALIVFQISLPAINNTSTVNERNFVDIIFRR